MVPSIKLKLTFLCLFLAQDEFAEEFNSMFAPLAEQQLPSKVVKPVPGFCIKAFQEKNEKKIFINICHTDGIPAPSDITELELTDILQSDEPHSYKVPMSLSDPRLTTDRSGKQETACDIAVNSGFFKKIEKLGLFQNFFITLIFEALENKYDIEIQADTWLILKNRTVFGSLVSHRIQDRDAQRVKDFNEGRSDTAGDPSNLLDGGAPSKKPLIEELPANYKHPKAHEKGDAGDSGIYNPDPVKLSISRANSSKPEHKLLQEIIDGEVTRLIAQFQLPDCTSAKELTLDVNDDRLILECRKRGYLFDGFVNVAIDADKVTSQFDLETKTLTVELPTVRNK